VEPAVKKPKLKDSHAYPFGNYPTYYAMRYKWKTPHAITAKDDPRLAVLRDNLPVGARMLDIGCNNGLFTYEIGTFLRRRRVRCFRRCCLLFGSFGE
jgi:hypothetical protein